MFTAIVTYIWYRCFAKKNGMNIDEIDLKTSAFSVFKTIMLALTVTGGTLLLVWGAQYFFKTNFSFLYWGIMPFGSFKIVDMLKVLPIFLIGYVISSIFINCMNYNTSYGKNKIVNILVLALVTAAVPALVSGAGWAKFMLTGVNDLFGAAYGQHVPHRIPAVYHSADGSRHLFQDPQSVPRWHHQRDFGHGNHLRELPGRFPGLIAIAQHDKGWWLID